jgi:hypothetical protein
MSRIRSKVAIAASAHDFPEEEGSNSPAKANQRRVVYILERVTDSSGARISLSLDLARFRESLFDFGQVPSIHGKRTSLKIRPILRSVAARDGSQIRGQALRHKQQAASNGAQLLFFLSV